MRAHRINAAVLAALPALAVGGSLYYSGNAAAAALYYNPGISSYTSTGYWVGADNWSSTGSAPYTTAWTDGSDAIFTPPSITLQAVAVDQNVTANSIQDNSTVSGTSVWFSNPGQSGTAPIFTLTTSTIEAVTATTFVMNDVELGGSALTVQSEPGFSGAKVNLTFEGGNTNITGANSYNGTITFNNTNNGSFIISAGAEQLSGPNTNIAVTGTSGVTIQTNNSVTMGTLSATNSTAVAQIVDGGSNPTLTINESSSTSAYALFNSSFDMSVDLIGGGTLTLDSAKALQSTFTNFVIGNTGRLQIANTASYTTASSYVPVTISNGGKLSNSATGQFMIGNSQTYTAGTGAFAGSNTNGYNITTSGSTAYIDPTGIFGLTELNATAGGAEGFSTLGDLLSVYSLTTADTNAGNFVIDSTGLTGFTPGTPYNVLQWANFTGELGDFTTIAPAGYTASLGISGDDLQVTFNVVPEPSTMALLLLGGLPMLVRRRRTKVASI